MKNQLIDLNNHLFAAMERLNDEELAGEKLKEEIERCKTITGLAQNIIGNARVVLDAHIAVKEYGIGTALPLIGSLGNEPGKGAGK
jgi:hypothetical protein